MTARRIAVVSGGLGQPSGSRLLADRLAGATRDHLLERGVDAAVDVVELRELARDLADHLVTGFPSPALAAALRTVADADGLIAVSPVFSASYSGLFKTFFDVLDRDALTDLPTLVAATGGSARHSLVTEHALRPLLTYLKAVVVPTAVFAATDDFGADDADVALGSRIERAARQLAELVSAGSRTVPDDPFDAPVDFERLLGRLG
ncbi:FMN reductase [Nakamurella endophytica]|uniref:FMN reductase n=1 Tax=Nakamurella endophytica TaxID=1748367 RepID=A0A917SUF7_9ACTN|nr:FMN reductase [Nakamurella endophytica]GGL99150.1 FMN reductase [Nakamurella endophytica]